MRLVVVLLLAACTPGGRAWRLDNVAVSAEPAALDFGAVPLGQLATESLLLTNTGTESTTVALSVAEPFRVDRASVDLGAGGTATVTLSFAPVDYNPAAADLAVGGLTVPLSGATDPDSDADGHDAAAAGGDDCDDADPGIHAGATETCYDGVDEDCDGLADDTDCDGDGVDVTTDCDDTDATVSPEAPEAGPDGRDDDCDGRIDENLHVPGALFFAEISPGPAASVELCNHTGDVLHLDQLRVETSGGSGVLDPALARDPGPLDPGACAAFAPQATGYFAWALSLPVEPTGDTLILWSDEVELDRLEITGTWGWEADVVQALAADHASADENDDAASWCRPNDPSWGSPNPGAACP